MTTEPIELQLACTAAVDLNPFVMRFHNALGLLRATKGQKYKTLADKLERVMRQPKDRTEYDAMVQNLATRFEVIEFLPRKTIAARPAWRTHGSRSSLNAAKRLRDEVKDKASDSRLLIYAVAQINGREVLSCIG